MPRATRLYRQQNTLLLSDIYFYYAAIAFISLDGADDIYYRLHELVG